MGRKTEEEKKVNKQAYNKRYYEEHKEYFSNRKKNNREHENILNREYRVRAKERDLRGFRERANESEFSYRERKKKAVFNHYSKGTNRCANCGESRIACLSIDHIAGGGTKHKLSLNMSGGGTFYRWLIRNNYPKGYQVLCMNCQFIKRVMNREYGERG